MSSAKSIEFLPNGENSLCLLFSDKENWPLQVLAEQLRLNLKNAVEVIPTYDTITVVFDDSDFSLNDKTKELVSLIDNTPLEVGIGQTHQIPVCYDPEVATDLQDVCEQLKLSHDELISLHTAGEYSVAMLGFQPGFIYLDGLTEQLTVPRKASPTLSLGAGSIAIGGNQTGIYSLPSPGGWWVIGRTPKQLFKAELSPPVLVNPGDRLRFRSISLNEYQELTHAD